MKTVKMLAAMVLAASAALVGAAPASATTSTIAAPTDDVTWTVRTASNDLGENRTSFSYDIRPGDTLEDAMVVANRGKTPLTLGVYAADGFTTEAGQMDLVTKDAESIAVGSWVRPTSDNVTIKPGKSAEVPFKVMIPENATPGDHAGGIITSLVQEDSEETINVDRRLGIQIKLRVDGDLKPGLAIEGLSVEYRGTPNPAGKGDADVSYTIHNTGNAILSGQGNSTITGPFGWFEADGDAQVVPEQLLPGESWKVTGVVHDVVPSGRLTARVTLVPIITDAAGSSTTLPPVVETATTWALPWTLGLLIVVVVALVVGMVVLSRRRRRRRQELEDARVDAAVKEALETR
ncbi:WxL protein peptidoglycan domain-containing protein [Kineosporia succinea]|uniref:Membrane protein n=1 Tax=Kineosporia succinea TaxID=84632 RepID=A0ABT9NZE0_9ACTN|nr:DUF916 domain-containing protein [Kineosporia succinea]MDP9825806.1 putative membrane protein [Kineosporia succinea]